MKQPWLLFHAFKAEILALPDLIDRALPIQLASNRWGKLSKPELHQNPQYTHIKEKLNHVSNKLPEFICRAGLKKVSGKFTKILINLTETKK